MQDLNSGFFRVSLLGLVVWVACCCVCFLGKGLASVFRLGIDVAF